MDVRSITCCVSGCGYSPFPMDVGFYNRARETHEFWHCPAGHSQHFVGETPKERRHREQVARLERRIAKWRQTALTCPWPTCREYVYAARHSLYEHLRRVHGMPTVWEVRDSA